VVSLEIRFSPPPEFALFVILMQNEQTFLKIFKERRKEFYSSPSYDSCLEYTIFTKKRMLQGKNIWYKVVYVFYMKSHNEGHSGKLQTLSYVFNMSKAI